MEPPQELVELSLAADDLSPVDNAEGNPNLGFCHDIIHLSVSENCKSCASAYYFVNKYVLFSSVV